ncbi:hypothetical protein BGW80DRAFT_1272472 [Lactifluus volemus]|nr:hypothetical protein BGW80DRAFT_1272472 [Lactifluus volemus]
MLTIVLLVLVLTPRLLRGLHSPRAPNPTSPNVALPPLQTATHITTRRLNQAAEERHSHQSLEESQACEGETHHQSARPN